MVGYDVHTQQLTSTQYATAGAVSGAITRVCLQPLDVLKIRFQIQIEPSIEAKSKSIFKYRGIFQALTLIPKEEGILALWKGHVPAQILSVLYGAVQFTSFEVFTKLSWSVIPHQNYAGLKPVTHFICGGLSGFCSTLVVQPIDVLRTRLVAQGEPKIYNGLRHAVVSMYHENGVRTFYKGLVPTLVEIFPQVGMRFGFYNIFETLWSKYTNTLDYEVSVSKSLFCGIASGVLTKLIIHPLDVVKKRLQIEGFEFRENKLSDPLSGGTVKCVKNIFRNEGVRGFYKGLQVNVLKGGCVVGLSFLAYEQCCKYIRLLNAWHE